MQRYQKTKTDKIFIDGWGDAWLTKFGHASEDGYFWEFQYTSLTTDERDMLIKAWNEQNELFHLIASCVKLEQE